MPSQDPEPDYSSDAPLSSPDGDVFQRWPFSKQIAHVIRDRKGTGSLVVGLYGSWGEGKTTVLNFVEHALKEEENVVVVRFNPWRFGNEETLIRSFFEVLATAIGEKLSTRWEDLGGDLRKYAKGVSFGAFGAKLNADDALKAATDVGLEGIRDRLGKALAETGTRVVVVVDDIDRLDKQEVHAVFRLVKLSADFDGVTYLLAFDPDVVAASLQDRYGSVKSDAGRDFLDKIVTVPLQIPPARPSALLEMAVDIINEAIALAGVEVEDDAAFVRAFYDGIIPALRTPRAARRYGNALLFALPILAGEVNATDQMLIEGMRVVYPALYEHVRSHPELYATNHPTQGFDFSSGDKKREERRARVEAVIQEHAPQYITAATTLIRYLFPDAHGHSTSPVGPLRSKQRAASDWHFDRYFNYSLPRDAVSDRAFAQAIESAESQGADGVAEHLGSLITDSNRSVIADMIYDVRESVPLETVRAIALGVARVGDLFSEYDGGFLMGLSSENRATAALEDMVGRLAAEARQALSEEIVQETSSISFAMNYRGWVDPRATGKGEGILTEEGADRLVRIIAERVRDSAGDSPPHLTSPDSASRQYGHWMMGLGKQEVADYLENRLSSHPVEAWPVLRSQLPRSQSSNRPGTYLGDYSRESYNALALYVDPAVLAEAFIATYDERVINAGFVDMDYVLGGAPDARGLTPEEASVAQFMHVHRIAVESAEREGAAGEE